MASDYLLEIDGIKGESQDDKHKDTIEIDSFHFGATNTGSMSSGTGGGTGKVAFHDVTISAKVNKASAELLKAIATHKHIKKAILFIRKGGGDPQDFLKITMEDVLVTSFHTIGKGGSDPTPVDQFTLNFANIEYSYAPQKADGSLDSPVVAKHNLKTGKG